MPTERMKATTSSREVSVGSLKARFRATRRSVEGRFKDGCGFIFGRFRGCGKVDLESTSSRFPG